MLPVINGPAVDFPRVPTPPHEPRRLLAVGPPTPLTPMPRHPHHLPPLKRPRVPTVAAPLARQRVPAIRAAPPIPGRPLRQRAEPLHERPPPLYDVHGLTTMGCSLLPMVAEPFPPRYPLELPRQHKLEPSQSPCLTCSSSQPLLTTRDSYIRRHGIHRFGS